jgi:hypothetical protein
MAKRGYRFGLRICGEQRPFIDNLLRQATLPEINQWMWRDGFGDKC